MILADKIIFLRKKNGWSQEQLAEQLNISRQSVSKWESGASIPDLDKIIMLSKMFGVSTDYLLKDELEEAEQLREQDESEGEKGHIVSVEEADAYMNLAQEAAPKMALATLLCILSPMPLILLGGLSEYRETGLSEDIAGGIGIAILLILVVIAVMIFIWKGMQLSQYEYLDKEKIVLQYGVKGIVEKKKQDFDKKYRSCIAIGTALCIIAVIPLMVAGGFNMGDFILVCCMAVLFAMVACGVYLFVWACTIHGSYEKLLQEGDYTIEKKEARKRTGIFTGFYWCIVTAIYLCMILPNNNWKLHWRDNNSWVIWPVAAVLYAAILGIVTAAAQKKKNNEF